MKYNDKILRTKLIYYLTLYVNKPNLKMKMVIYSIIQRLKNNQPISYKQFLSVVKFLEREKEFKGRSKEHLINLFTPIIYNKTKEPSYVEENNLEPFLN